MAKFTGHWNSETMSWVLERRKMEDNLNRIRSESYPFSAIATSNQQPPPKKEDSKPPEPVYKKPRRRIEVEV
jgi:hypothetical protein